MSYLIVSGLSFLAGVVLVYLYYRHVKAQLKAGKLSVSDWLKGVSKDVRSI